MKAQDFRLTSSRQIAPFDIDAFSHENLVLTSPANMPAEFPAGTPFIYTLNNDMISTHLLHSAVGLNNRIEVVPGPRTYMDISVCCMTTVIDPVVVPLATVCGMDRQVGKLKNYTRNNAWYYGPLIYDAMGISRIPLSTPQLVPGAFAWRHFTHIHLGNSFCVGKLVYPRLFFISTVVGNKDITVENLHVRVYSE